MPHDAELCTKEGGIDLSLHGCLACCGRWLNAPKVARALRPPSNFNHSSYVAALCSVWHRRLQQAARASAKIEPNASAEASLGICFKWSRALSMASSPIAAVLITLLILALQPACEAIRFDILGGSSKCLGEEIGKGVLVVGEYKVVTASAPAVEKVRMYNQQSFGTEPVTLSLVYCL